MGCNAIRIDHRAPGARPFLRRLWPEERGTAVVEFALVAPLLFLLVFAIIDIGRAYYTLNALVSSVREGARLAALKIQPDLSNLASATDSVRAMVREAAPPMGGAPISDQQIAVQVNADNTVTVSVRNYPFQFVTPLARVVGKSQLLLTRQATFHLEYAN